MQNINVSMLILLLDAQDVKYKRLINFILLALDDQVQQRIAFFLKKKTVDFVFLLINFWNRTQMLLFPTRQLKLFDQQQTEKDGLRRDAQ